MANFSDLFKTKWDDPQSLDMSTNTQSPGEFISSIQTPTNLAWKDMPWSERIFGMQNQNGYKFGGIAAPALQLAQTGLNAYLGFKQLGQAEDTLNFQKDAFSKQFENQRTLTNAQLKDRQKARVGFNSNTQSVDSYMKENGV